jgi:hypothetical protein
MAELGTGPYHEVMSIYSPFDVTGMFGIPIQDIVAKIFDRSLLILRQYGVWKTKDLWDYLSSVRLLPQLSKRSYQGELLSKIIYQLILDFDATMLLCNQA